MTSHLNYECGKEPKFECQDCGKKYYQRFILNAHYRRVHYKKYTEEILAKFKYK